MGTAVEGFFGLSAHRCSQLWSVDMKRDMSHTVTAEIIKAFKQEISSDR